jgi:hypothetical protein
MKSSARSDRLDLARDLPTTDEDSVALQRAKADRPLDDREYIRFLEQLPSLANDALRAKRGPRADRPFELG